jgi:osmotically-inducible protein OsmY
MANQRNGRNVALPEDRRPSWRPQDDNSMRMRRPQYWEDRDDREHDRTRELEAEWHGHSSDRYGSERNAQYEGQGQSGYGAGRVEGDRAFRNSDWQFRGHRGKGPKGYQRSDERIRELVCEALTEHDEIDASNIEVSVADGEVTLKGMVEHRHAKRLAEDIIESISGVRDIHNQIRIANRDEGRT